MHYVYCWELGSDLGHIHLLATIGRALTSRGHKFSAIVGEITHAWSCLHSLNITWYPAPQTRLPLRNTNPQNHADILSASGYQDANLLSSKLCAWRSLFDLLKPDCVIGEAAPTAMLVARQMRLRNVSLDTGFFCPPLFRPLAPLREGKEANYDDLMRREDRTLQVINQAFHHLGFRPLPDFKAVFDGETYWLTWPEINHFGYHSPDRHLGPLCSELPGVVQDWPRGPGDKIFVYLKPDCPESIPALEWCLRQGYRVNAYLPRWPAHALKKFESTKRVAISREPLDLKTVMSACSKVLCHGGIGTVTYALGLGKTLLLLPTQVEQLRTAQAAVNQKLAVLPALGSAGLNFDAVEVQLCRERAELFSINKRSERPSALSRLIGLLE